MLLKDFETHDKELTEKLQAKKREKAELTEKVRALDREL